MNRELPVLRVLTPSSQLVVTTGEGHQWRSAEGTGLESLVPFGKTFGALTVGDKAHGRGRPRRYPVQCSCGWSGMETALKLLDMLDRGWWCGRPECSSVTFFDVAGVGGLESVRIQLYALQMLCPGELPSYWGGALDDMPRADFDAAVQNLHFHLAGVRRESRGATWVARMCGDLPFIEGNVRYRSNRDVVFKRLGTRTVFDCGEQFSLMELCRLATTGGVSQMTPERMLWRLYQQDVRADLLDTIANWKD